MRWVFINKEWVEGRRGEEMHVVCMHAPFSIVASCKNILMQGLKVLFPRIVYKAQIPLYI